MLMKTLCLWLYNGDRLKIFVNILATFLTCIVDRSLTSQSCHQRISKSLKGNNGGDYVIIETLWWWQSCRQHISSTTTVTNKNYLEIIIRMTLNLEYEWFKFGNPYWIMIILIDLSSLPAKHSLKLIDRDYLKEIISSEYLNFETIQRNHSSFFIFLNKDGGVFFWKIANFGEFGSRLNLAQLGISAWIGL